MYLKIEKETKWEGEKYGKGKTEGELGNFIGNL
jgi:hypothetical protein